MATDSDTAQAAPAERDGGALAFLRRHAPLIVTGLLFVAGAYALYRLLAPLDMRVVVQQIAATSPAVIAGAVLATAIGYAALIGYDWSAMRYIGKTAPLSSVALGGFLGYALGNTIGLSAVSGGAVRYRIYSALGLDAYHVAAISTFAALAFGVGAILIGLAALALHPAALSDLVAWPPEVLRIAAIATCAAITGGAAWIAHRGGTLRIGRFALAAPTGPDMIRQLLITFVDIAMAALVLHLLLPTGTLPYANILAVYAVATMVGVASHVPGGIGVFESIVIAALPASVPLNDAVTALLLYRIIYFLLPFVVALLLLSIAEVWAAAGDRLPQAAALKPVVRAGRSLIPMATGTLVLASGVFMMFAGLLPNARIPIEELETYLPLAMIEGGPMISSLVGSFLAVLAIPVFHRSRLAYWLVLGTLGFGVAVAAVQTRDFERVAILSGMALILWPCRREFYRRARLMQGLFTMRWTVFTLSILVSLGLTWVLLHQPSVAPDETWWQVSGSHPAAMARRATLTAGVILSGVLLYSALRVARAQADLPGSEDLARARDILAVHGDGSDGIMLTGDKALMFGPAGNAVLAYGVKGGSWIAMGAPVGLPGDVEDLSWAFHDAARAAGARPVFYEAPAAFAPQAIDMGLTLHKMGEEAIVDLAGFSLDGPARKRLRTAWNRARRDGLSVEIHAPPHPGAMIEALRPISDTWLETHAGREKRFSVGRFDPDWLAANRIALVRLNGETVAFATIMETRRSAAVDLMRYRAGVPSGTMEFLFIELLLAAKAEGLARFSLGMVPFAGMPGRKGATLWARFGSLIYAHGDRFYSFGGLRRFKSKFDPTWHPRYFCCRSALPPVGPLSEAARLIAGSARGIVGK